MVSPSITEARPAVESATTTGAATMHSASTSAAIMLPGHLGNVG